MLSLNNSLPFPGLIMCMRVFMRFYQVCSSVFMFIHFSRKLFLKTKQFSALWNRPLLTPNAWWGLICLTASHVDGDPGVRIGAITPTFGEHWLNFTLQHRSRRHGGACNFSQQNFHSWWWHFSRNFWLTPKLRPWAKLTRLLVNQRQC